MGRRRWNPADHPRNQHDGRFIEKGSVSGWAERLSDRMDKPPSASPVKGVNVDAPSSDWMDKLLAGASLPPERPQQKKKPQTPTPTVYAVRDAEAPAPRVENTTTGSGVADVTGTNYTGVDPDLAIESWLEGTPASTASMALREGDENPNWDTSLYGMDYPEFLDQMDRATAPSSDGFEVWRGLGSAREVFGDALEQDLTGKQWTDPAYASTSVDRTVAHNYARSSGGDEQVVLRIVAPKGTPSATLNHGSGDFDDDPDDDDFMIGGEDDAEVLLGRGLTYQVVADTGPSRDGIRQLDVVVVAGSP